MAETYQFEQHVSKNGINYMSVGTSFTDARNVYLEDMTKLGMIIFVEKQKPVYDGYRHKVSRYTDGFIFEPIGNMSIKCNDFKNIAKHVYQLNEQFKEMKKTNGK